MKDFDEKDMTDEPYEDFKNLIPEKTLEDQQKEEKEQLRKKMLARHMIALPVYFIGQLVLGLIIGLLILSIPGAKVDTSPDEQVVLGVTTDTNGLAFMKNASYDTYSNKYGKYLKTVKYNDEYLIVTNVYNYSTFEKDWLIKDAEENLVINLAVVDEFINGTRTNWDEKREIKLYLTGEGFGARPEFITDYTILNTEKFLEPKTDLSPGASNVASFLIYIGLTAAVVLLLFPNIKEDFKAFKNKDATVMVGILTGFGFAFAGGIVANAVRNLLEIFLDIPGGEAVNQISIELAMKSAGAPLMILSALILAPIVEELIFRKTIFELSRNKWLGLVISSVLFGLIHVSSELMTLTSFGHFLYVFVPYVFMGAGFGVAYIVYKQNVLTTIGAHMLWNLFAIISVFLV